MAAIRPVRIPVPPDYPLRGHCKLRGIHVPAVSGILSEHTDDRYSRHVNAIQHQKQIVKRAD